MEESLKQLLLKDLCSRLPYGVKVKTPYNDANLVGVVNRKGVRKDIDYVDVVTDKQTYPIRYIKPYLRPMSSMTEEENKEMYHDCYIVSIDFDRRTTDMVAVPNSTKIVDWLNAHHFDYKGLIEKGLAISTEVFNPYKD